MLVILNNTSMACHLCNLRNLRLQRLTFSYFHFVPARG